MTTRTVTSSTSSFLTSLVTTATSSSSTQTSSTIYGLTTQHFYNTTTSISNKQNFIQNLTTGFVFSSLFINNQSLLLSNYDLTGCLVNCTNKGLCKFDLTNNQFICECDLYYFGLACQIDSRPCSFNKCLNNGTCVDYTNSINFNMTLAGNSTYNCLCDEAFRGAYCEIKLSPCENETCSYHGECIESTDRRKTCECHDLYKGETCQIESSELKAIKEVISASTIISTVIIACFFMLIIFLDLTHLRTKKNLKPKKQKQILKINYIH